jgi:hypothetical protein
MGESSTRARQTGSPHPPSPSHHPSFHEGDATAKADGARTTSVRKGTESDVVLAPNADVALGFPRFPERNSLLMSESTHRFCRGGNHYFPCSGSIVIIRFTGVAGPEPELNLLGTQRIKIDATHAKGIVTNQYGSTTNSNGGSKLLPTLTPAQLICSTIELCRRFSTYAKSAKSGMCRPDIHSMCKYSLSTPVARSHPKLPRSDFNSVEVPGFGYIVIISQSM